MEKTNRIKRLISLILIGAGVIFGIVLFLFNSMDYYHQKYPIFVSEDDLNDYLQDTYWTTGDADYEFGHNSVDVYYSNHRHFQKTSSIVATNTGAITIDAAPYIIKPKEAVIVSSDGSVKLTQIPFSEKKINAFTVEETEELVKAENKDKSKHEGNKGGSGSSYSSSISDDDKLLCWLVTEEYVKSQLKSPSSAKFPSTYTSSDISYSRSGTTYTVRSYVDADNSFGANMRQYFTVQIEIVGDKNRVVSCVFD